MFGGFDYFIKLHDVGVSHHLENMDLTHYSRNVRLLLDLFFLKDFDGDLLVRENMCPEPDFSKGSLTDRLA